MKENPYTLAFGYPPVAAIERSLQMERIINDFDREHPANYINLVTGVRGSGKTVFISQIAKRLGERKKWIVVNLNVQRDLLTSLAARLDSDRTLQSWFRKAEINLQAFGLGLSVKSAPPVTDIEEVLLRMLRSIDSHKKRVLITIDEAVNSREMRVFASAFQIFLREGLPVFLIMTGLFKDIDRLRNAPGMTFLERAPRTLLQPLDADAIAKNYADNLSLKASDANRYAAMTRGYSFGFQVLGYFLFENLKEREKAVTEAKNYLYEFAYNKIWSETSAKDKRLIRAVAEVPGGEVLKIRTRLQETTNQFNPYRDRLIKAGIAHAPGNGYLELSLPFFEEFAKRMEKEA